jgi:hypothetical protein
VLTAVLWLLASLGFKLYVNNFASYTETYGAIGGVMVLMLWCYITGLVMLFGAELNAEIEHASNMGQTRTGPTFVPIHAPRNTTWSRANQGIPAIRAMPAAMHSAAARCPRVVPSRAATVATFCAMTSGGSWPP